MNSLLPKYILNILFLLLSLSVATQPQLNEDYQRIPDGLVKDEGITEIFGYWCPACFSFENTVQDIKERRPDIKVNQIPAGNETIARLYYTIKALNLGDEAHINVYKDWQLKRKSFRTASDMAAFAKRHGYDEQKFMEVYSSFGVGLKAKNAIRLVNSLGNAGVFDSVPTVIVNGKYKVIRGNDVEKNIFNIIYLSDS
tara:strand:- start:2737 stop:3330 length:594 start_codon:yes stop_codon:yes gene_type:complete